MTTLLPELEKQLIRAAARAPTAPSGSARPAASKLASGLALVMVATVTLAIGAGALILLRSHKRPAPSAAAASRQKLINILAVLRRPQTKADLNLSILRGLESGPLAGSQGPADVPLIRFATTTPWGEKLYLVPRKPLTAAQIATLARQSQRPPGFIARLRGRETLDVFSSQGGGGASDAATIEAGRAVGTEGAGVDAAGGSSETRLILVVPDGVAKVKFVLPRQPQPAVPGAPIYPHSATVTAPAHANVVAVQLNREFDGATPPMIWYSADGRAIKRLGNLAAVNRVVASPQPGPETPLSRAAERDPSTPNRVWVTPSVGGPHTNFMLHFRVLLNHANYTYKLSGTNCPAITVNGGDGGGGALGLRGRVWSDVVDAVAEQTWCPGIYHLSAAVMELRRNANVKAHTRPFGTATFTVRR